MNLVRTCSDIVRPVPHIPPPPTSFPSGALGPFLERRPAARTCLRSQRPRARGASHGGSEAQAAHADAGRGGHCGASAGRGAWAVPQKSKARSLRARGSVNRWVATSTAATLPAATVSQPRLPTPQQREQWRRLRAEGAPKGARRKGRCDERCGGQIHRSGHGAQGLPHTRCSREVENGCYSSC